jgi:hypothetical protein
MPAIRRAEVDAHSKEWTDPDVLERDRRLPILRPQLPLGKAGVVNVERRFTVQDHDEMVAVRGDLVTISSPEGRTGTEQAVDVLRLRP